MPFKLRRIKALPSWIFGVFAVFLSASTASHAQSRIFEDPDDADKVWSEIVILLPAAPATENLLQFYVSPTATQTFTVDAKSISVGADGVVRYTLLATSIGGAQSISYEGVRCDVRQRKLYAFGRPDGSWSRARRDQWEPIDGTSANRQQAVLAADYFCLGGTVAGKAADMVERIRWKRSLQRSLD